MHPWEYTKVEEALKKARAAWGSAELITTGQTVNVVTDQYPNGLEIFFQTILQYKCPKCSALFTKLEIATTHFLGVHAGGPDVA